MKNLIYFLTYLVFTAPANAQELENIAPTKFQSHFVYKDQIQVNKEFVEVKGYPYFEHKSSSGSYRNGLDYKEEIRNVGTLPTKIFEFEKQTAKAVLRANFEITKHLEEKQSDGTTRLINEVYTGNGSAVVVGKNLVLTNKHVLDVLKTGESPKVCPGGWLSTGFNAEIKVKCLEIITCGQDDENIFDSKGNKTDVTLATNGDWCLMRTTPTPDGKEIGEIITPFSLATKIKPGAGLKKVATIGNPAGLGIQFSWGQTNSIKFNPNFDKISDRAISSTAFALSGNSGGALINADGELLGIVSRSLADDIASAEAIRSDYIVLELQKKLDKKTFEELKVSLSDFGESNKCHEADILPPEGRGLKKLENFFNKIKGFFKITKTE